MLQHTVSELTLSNGASGLLIDIPGSSLMEVRVSFRAGDVYCADPSKWETAHTMEHLMLGANGRFTAAQEFKAEIEKNGAYINAATQHVGMTYEATCPDFEWHDFLRLFIDSLNDPRFLKDEFTAELGNVREELLGTVNDPSLKLQQYMTKVYGFSAKTDTERLKLLKNIRLEDMQNHYERTHYARNMRFAIAGNLAGKQKDIEALFLAAAFGGRDQEMLEYPIENAQKPSETIYIKDNSLSNVYFAVDFFMERSLRDEEMYALSIASHILTGTLHSRILGRAREKGLIYHVSSDFYRTRSQSCLWFASQISVENLQSFLDILVSELARLRDGQLDDGEFMAAKRYALGGYQLSAQTAGTICDNYVSQYLYDGRIDEYYHHFPAKLEKIAKQDVIDVLREMLEDEVWGIGLSGVVSDELRQTVYNQISALWQK